MEFCEKTPAALCGTNLKVVQTVQRRRCLCGAKEYGLPPVPVNIVEKLLGVCPKIQTPFVSK